MTLCSKAHTYWLPDYRHHYPKHHHRNVQRYQNLTHNPSTFLKPLAQQTAVDTEQYRNSINKHVNCYMCVLGILQAVWIIAWITLKLNYTKIIQQDVNCIQLAQDQDKCQDLVRMVTHTCVLLKTEKDLTISRTGACNGTVGWGTALQAGRSRVWLPMVSLGFFIGIILPATLWHWGRLSLQQKWVPGIFPGG